MISKVFYPIDLDLRGTLPGSRLSREGLLPLIPQICSKSVLGVEILKRLLARIRRSLNDLRSFTRKALMVISQE